jgi:dipeptidyl aminopeptidase/acylaminoacyl peptidase
MTDRKQPSLPGIIGAGVLIGGALVALGAGGFIWFAAHPPRLPVWHPRKHADLDLEPVTFAARDGVQIAGWFAAAEGEAQGGVILCHGHPMNRVEMLPWAQLLLPAGFHILLFDFRALGQSEGNLCTIGYHEVRDLLGAADYLTARPEMAGLPLGVYGISMGAAVSLMAAGQDERFAAVAAHAAYASLDTAIHQRGRMLLGPAGSVLAHPARYWARRWLDIDPCQVSPLEMVSSIAPRPLFLSHGERDVTIDPADARALYAAAGEPKTLRLLRRSRHVWLHPSERPEYEAELLGFFTRHLRLA